MTDYIKRKWSTMRKLLVVIIIGFLAATSVMAGAVTLYYQANLKSVSSVAESQPFVIEKNATAKNIGSQLEQAGLIRNATVFDYYLWLNHVRDGLQAGSYQLRPNMTVPEVVGILTHGKVSSDLITIVPGERIDQLKAAFVKDGYSQKAVDAAFDPAQYADHPALADKPAEASLEGYLYPESFQRTADTKPEVLIRQSLDQMDKYLTTDIRAAFAKHGLSAHQGIILASMVEQEVSNASDRPTVAQVFLTRYKKGEMLGSDVTSYYGAIAAGKQIGVGESISFDSPYNTRMHVGLPIGPISNVTKSSLQAVAEPAATDYVFFLAGDDGKTYFAHTNEEHLRNKELYCKKLCAL